MRSIKILFFIIAVLFLSIGCNENSVTGVNPEEKIEIYIDISISSSNNFSVIFQESVIEEAEKVDSLNAWIWSGPVLDSVVLFVAKDISDYKVNGLDILRYKGLVSFIPAENIEYWYAYNAVENNGIMMEVD